MMQETTGGVFSVFSYCLIFDRFEIEETSTWEMSMHAGKSSLALSKENKRVT